MEFLRYQTPISIIGSVLLLPLILRTALWHIQNWQLREYRCDRMNAYLKTKDGRKDIYSFWFFKGILPRPKFSFRVSLLFVWLFIVVGVIFFYVKLDTSYSLLITTLLIERTMWCWVMLGVRFSAIPVTCQKIRLYHQAKQVIQKGKNIHRIGITGSYGKSSTKEILVHLLQDTLGKENVLFNPANNNNEVAIARLVLSHASFFKPSQNKKIAVFEIGAYSRGEIRTVCHFSQPHTGILTGLNEQHVELFGSKENISKAKFELAEDASQDVFFNADNPQLNNIFDQRKIKANVSPVSKKLVKAIKTHPDKTEFEWRDQKCVLPWGGEFFVTNALLALETAYKIFDIAPKELAKSLKTLPPLKRALNLKTLHNGATLLEDIYSANTDGVMGAIQHLGQFQGRKIFVGIPLRELGKEAGNAHKKIFERLHEIGAEIFWLKTDFAELGKNICGDNFHLISTDFRHITKVIQSLKKGDAVLLESRLPEKLLQSIQKY